MTYCHIRIERITGQENSLPAMTKPPFIKGSELDSNGKDSMRTQPVVSFKKVPYVGFGGMVCIYLATLGFSL